MGSKNEITDKTPNNEAIDQDEETYSFAMILSSAIALPMILKTAIELNLFEIISTFGPNSYVTPIDIVSKLPTKNPNAPVMIDRILRLLSSYSVVSCSVQILSNGDVLRLYGLTPVCKYLIENDDGVSLAAGCLMIQDEILIKSWYHLKDAVLEGGIPFDRAYGMSAFEYQKTDPRFNKVFNKGMSHHSTITMKRILETYQGFENLGSIVDVGGGTGAALNMIISKYPATKGINYDLAHVIENACPYNGLEHVGGDMFVSVPKGDAIFMEWILHDWSDEHCLQILKNCYDALPSNGKVILAECLIPESPNTSLAAKVDFHTDVIMLAHHPGGKERTAKEFETLAIGAGFERSQVLCNAFNTYIIELFKKV